jgi:hypothetical protein
MTYKIPDKYFFRLHHIRPRFKNDIEEVLLYVANSIVEMGSLPETEFNKKLNHLLYKFKKNPTKTKKTIDNWRTEIAALFSFIQRENDKLKPSSMATRLANSQYLDELFNYTLYTFQYPGGHNTPEKLIPQLQYKIKFKPCEYILKLLIEAEKIQKKPFSITAEELTQCVYYDLRVTRYGKAPKEVAKLILKNRRQGIKYDHKYEQLKTKKGKYRSSGDVYRYAGDILDYMAYANLLNHKGTGFYYYLNKANEKTINYHLNNSVWFKGYEDYYGKAEIKNKDILAIEEDWFSYVNGFNEIKEFTPQLGKEEEENIAALIQEYYSRLTGGGKYPTKIIGDFGESLVLLHEYIRTEGSKRQHIIQKIPTHLGVGYDIQSIEMPIKKRYIEVKTTKSKKAIKNNVFRLTANELDTAATLGEKYYIYYLVVNKFGKKIFMIQNPVRQKTKGTLTINQNLTVKFKESSGKWTNLLEMKK